ncbi:MAG: serine hydrolase domain-containing protein [Solirubrobacterales bacterium]
MSRRHLAVAAALSILLFAAPAAAAKSTVADVQRGLERLVATPGGPPGAIATLYRNGKLTTLSAGRADVRRRGASRADDHMRIASVAKAFSGAVALNLVRAGKLRLDQTIGELLPELPPAWSSVTVAQMLNHTSGLPDYTKSEAFAKQAETDPHGFVAPAEIIDWVRKDPLEFAPGSSYQYSNTDNIVVGLIAQAITGESYRQLLRRIVFGPAHLTQTSFPTRPAIPSPFIHGYLTAPGEKPQDVSTMLSPSGAWASGAILSTPRDLNAFVRADLGLEFFDRAQQRAQMSFWPGGESSPPGPGRNSAGLALFRYQTKCGTVYGHTGNFPGYVQFAAATANGRRAVTTSLNIPAPKGKLLAQLRRLQTTAVCALLGR